MTGTLFGVGVGPGDPSLLTVKAIETIQMAAVIAAPDTGGEKTALNVVAKYISGKEILPCPMPMTRDKARLAESHRESADRICERLEEGRSVAFITLGDPSVYSTYMYLHRLVLKRGYEAKMIPGVPSFCAAAAALGISLCEGGESLHIFPASYEGLGEGIRLKGSKVLMKSGRRMAGVRQTLKDAGLAGQTRMVERCGMENEKVYRHLEDVGDDASYFSILLIKEHE